MTREEAIARIKNHKIVHKMNEPRAIYISEALDMAIQALDQEPCEDCISRKAVLDYIYNDLGLGDEENGKDVERQMELEDSYRYVKSLSPVKQEPTTGHWTRELIRNEKGGCIGAKMICSECDNDNKHDEYMNYCPNCGAKMD